METKKLRMNNPKFIRIWTTVIALLVLIAIAATVLMNFFSLSMEIFLGRGKMVITENPNMVGADTKYYPDPIADLNAHADAVAVAIAEEGEVLFKNNGVLPLAKGSDVTPFGYRYISPVYGGTGSGSVNTASSRIYTATGALNEYFNVNKEVENVLKSAKAEAMTSTEYQHPNESGGFEGAGTTIIEFNPEIYSGHEASIAGTTAIVFIGRVGGEGSDVTANVPGSAIYGKGYLDGTAHQLALSEYEKEMIRVAKANAENVVAIINSSNTIEIGEMITDAGDLSVDAILWIGGPGGQGFKAMAEILTGEVNPSGKTVDTWATDLMTNPAMANFGNNEYDNLMLLQGGFPTPVGDPTEMNFVEYEENIYVGYRYFETVHDTNGSFTVFGEDGKSYEDAVQLPFGQGLSYTDFNQEFSSHSDTDDEVVLKVRVTNTGDVAGKDAVQVYYNPPYTEDDIAWKVEKATKNLIAFAKTGLIQPGETEEVELRFSKEDMSSYCYTHTNPDGTLGAYFLEKGNYDIILGKNAHEAYDSFNVDISSTIWYDNTNPRQSEKDGQAMLNDDGEPTEIPAVAEINADADFIAAHNRFQNLSDHMEATSQLTRASGTLVNTATAPTAEDKANIPEGFYYTEENGVKTLQHIDLSNNTYLGNVPESKVYTEDMPVTGAPKALSLSDMRGLSYFDPRWDVLMDQLDLSEEDLYIALAASYDQTAQVASVGKPATVDFDGPQGIVGSITDATEFTAYPSEPIIAATFNTDLTYDMGEAVGQEAATAGVNTWYAPAMNIHRAAFSGRNFEYYSEDPVLSGYMAIAEVSGCSEQGLITTIKHFALNDEEMYNNDRSRVSVWVNEQTMREIYLKPFEMAVKYARASLKSVNEDGETVVKTVRGSSAVMGCMNYIGTVWGGSNYELLTEILRDEWGFQGFVVTDMVMNAGSNSVDQCLRSGSDTWMAWGTAFTTLIEDHSSATGVTAIRRAVRNMCYSIANSRAMNGIAPGTTISYKTSPWKIGLAIFDTLVGIFAVAMIVYMVIRSKRAKEHPEEFAAPKAKKNKKA